MKNDKQILIDSFDEENDIILPNSIFGEILYIFFIIRDIYKTNENREQKWIKLKQQIRFFFRWMRVK